HAGSPEECAYSDPAFDPGSGRHNGARHLAGRLPLRASPQYARPRDRAPLDRRMRARSVRACIAEHAPDLPIIEVEASTATVDTAAIALNVEPGRIAKTLASPAGHN